MALYSRVHVWVTNEILTASDLNGEFNNILTNASAAQLIGYSSTVSQMQQTTDPGGVGTESLAGSTSDEIQRLRFTIKRITGEAQWYSAPATNIAAISTALTTAYPAGSIIMYGGAAAPTGYLLCDGSSVNRVTYAALFAAIGTAYGTANGNSFNLPDLRGKFARGVDAGAGNDPDAASRLAQATGGNTGDAVGSTQGSTFASHTHTDSGHAHHATGNAAPFGGSTTVGGVGTFTGLVTAVAGDTSTAAANIQASGGNETRPLNVNVNYIIKI